jgi:hypothetical protein
VAGVNPRGFFSWLGQARSKNGRPGGRAAVKTLPGFAGDRGGDGPADDKQAGGNRDGSTQASIFESRERRLVALNSNEAGRTGRQVNLSGLFTEKELDVLSGELRLDQAATLRHVRALASESSRGVNYDDPRVLEHARSDSKNYQFLIKALRDARYGRDLDRGGVGLIDTSSLSDDELVDLYEFSRFEADRVERNIDHLNQGLSHLKGPTAGYLTSKHRIKQRFYNHLAGSLEPMITAEMQDEYMQWD